MTRGIAPVAITTENDLENQKKTREIRPRNIFIPEYIFKEFVEVTHENEDFFSYISFYVVM